jgi:hypothetical protein
MNTAEKIRFIAKRKNFILGDVAEGTGQTRQNFSNKIKRNDFKESELSAIADFLGCNLKIAFIDKETKEEY